MNGDGLILFRHRLAAHRAGDAVLSSNFFHAQRYVRKRGIPMTIAYDAHA
jgi:hypothetical protein